MKTGNLSFIFWFEELCREKGDLLGERCANLGESSALSEKTYKRFISSSGASSVIEDYPNKSGIRPKDIQSVNAGSEGILRGDILDLPASLDLEEDPARVIHTWEEAPQIQHGEILMAWATSPYWMHTFPYIRLVVTDINSMLAYAPIFSQEFGVLRVSNVKTDTVLIKTGQRIRVDSSGGAVWILDVD